MGWGMRETLVKSEEFKDSPVGRIPKDWQVDKLVARASVFGGKRLPLGHLYSDTPTKFRYLRVLDFFERNIDFEALEFLKPSTFKALERYEIHNGNLFISIAGSLGYVSVFRPPHQQRTILTENAARIVLQDDSMPEFLAYQMNSSVVQKQIEAEKGTGGGVPKLALFRIENLLLVFPPREEQEKIVAILETFDKAIAHTSSLIAKLKQMKAGLLHDLLTRGLDENGELRNAIAHPEQFKDSPLGQIPKDWEVEKFEKLADAIDPQPDHRAPPEVNDGEPYIGVGDFRPDGSIDFNGCRKVSSAAVTKQQQRFSIEPGDIIFGKIGTIGLPKLLQQVGRRYALNANTVLIKPRGCASFVMWLLQSNFVEQQIQFETHSTSQPAFGILRIRAMLVPIPEPEEQRRLAAVLDVHDSRIRSEEAYLEKLKLQKQGLMHDLLTGKVRVNRSKQIEEKSDLTRLTMDNVH